MKAKILKPSELPLSDEDSTDEFNPFWKPPYTPKRTIDDCKKECEDELELNSTKTIEFYRKYGKKEMCEKYLFEKRWPNGYRCPICDCECCYESKRKSRILYQCKKCGNEGSLTSGTIFERGHEPLDKWFKMIFFVVSKEYFNTIELKNKIGINGNTAWRMRDKIERNVLKDNAYDIFWGLVEKSEIKAVKNILVQVSRTNSRIRHRWRKENSKDEKRENARITKAEETKEKLSRNEKASKKKMLKEIIDKCNIDEMVKQLTT